MTPRSLRVRVLAHEELNFLICNRIPRRLLTLLIGWLSRIESRWVVVCGLAIWRWCAHLDLSEAKPRHFRTLREVFIRELRDGARPIDPNRGTLASPCDAIVGASGQVVDGTVLQIKGSPYSLRDLLCDSALQAHYRDGTYVTLRLTAGMYHRFHAPDDCTVRQVTYISGDTWNVNPIALRRIASLFCRNERAVLQCELAGTSHLLTLVPVAAILVGTIRLHCLSTPLHLRHRGPNTFHCNSRYGRGQEMGWFELGSTIVVLAPAGSQLAPMLRDGSRVNMGQALLTLAG